MQCNQMVRSKDPWGNSHQCRNSGRVFESGKHWCAQHAPSAIARRNEKSMANYRKKIVANKIANLVGQLVTVLTMTDNDGTVEVMAFPGELTVAEATTRWAQESSDETTSIQTLVEYAEQDVQVEVHVIFISSPTST